MSLRLEALNRIARIGRLNEHQIRLLAPEINARISRFLSKKRQYVYVAFVVPKNPEGFPKWDETQKFTALYEARNEETVYRAGQEKFKVMNTTDQVFVDVVVKLEE
jgi:hypothetical protein